MNMYQLYCIFFHSSTFVSSITVKYLTMTAELVGISLEITIIFFIISLAVVIFSADKFIDFSSILAGRLGVSEFIIGLTLIAFGTSIPEIFVGVQSIQNQAENLAVSAYETGSIKLEIYIIKLDKRIFLKNSLNWTL